MSAGTLAGALAQVVLALLVGWVFSDAALRRLHLVDEGRYGSLVPERALAAIVGFVVLSLGLMVFHIVTGGAVFGVSWFVPVAAAVVLLSGRRHAVLPRVTRRWAWAGLGLVVLVALYVSPALEAGSSARTGDIPWHLGWTEQLLAGEPVPTGPAPEVGRNAYPWGLHAVVATLVRLVPGSDPLVALDALHLLIVVAIPLAAASLARRLHPRAGWGAAGAAALIGGFGWISATRPDFVLSPARARYGADLVVASPNLAYELLPPPLPRELALVILGAVGVAIVAIVRTGRKDLAAVCGVIAGSAGLVNVPVFASALAWMVAAGVVARRRRRVVARALLWAIGVFSLWAVPVAVDHARFGGFVNIHPNLGVEWPLWTALASWGLLPPLALAGIVAVATTRREDASVVLALGGATVTMLALARARAAFDWGLGGNATVLHQGRVWPVAHLLAAAFAGVALAKAYPFLRSRRPFVVIPAAALLVAVCVASPIFASLGMTRAFDEHRTDFIYGDEELSSGSFVRSAAARLDPADVVRVEGSNRLSFLLFQFSGVRLADYNDPRLEKNDLRIRYADLARAWDERMESGGFDADYIVVPLDTAHASEVLVEGRFGDRRWALVEA